MTNHKIPVAFICDDGYVMQTSVAITSMLANKLPETFYEIFVVTAGLSEQSTEIFKSFNSEMSEIKIITANTEKYIEFYKNIDSRFVVATPAALFKFDLSELIPQYDKIIYLDGDILVNNDLSSLYAYDLYDQYVGAVRDIPQVLYKKPHISLGFGTEYFNSGVMLMNLKKMREENMTEKLLKTKKKFEDYPLMDQNILNIAFAGNVLQLPLKYNVLYLNLTRSRKKYTFAKLNKVFGSSYNSIDEIYQDAVVIHFSSKEKPWKFFDVPLADEWLYYYNASPFGNIPLARNSYEDIKDNTEKIKKAGRYKNIIPIVLSTNDNYAPYLAVTIQSVIENSMINNFYDIYVFHSGLSENMIENLEAIYTANLSVTCINIKNCISDSLFTCAHYSVEMYYRVLIPEVLSQYSRAVYIDCDLVFTEDIAKLYNQELNGNILGACNNFVNNRMAKYLENTLHIQLNQYINSGVLVIDCKKFIAEKIKEKFFMTLSLRNSYSCPDQDVLSIVCMGKIQLLSDTWNFQWHHQFADTPREQLVSIYQQRYDYVMKNHNVIHYTSNIKPWNTPNKKFADAFWRYARNSDFYEQILFRNTNNSNTALLNQQDFSVKIIDLQNQIDFLKRENQQLKAINNEIRNIYQQISNIQNIVDINCCTNADIYSDDINENILCIRNLSAVSNNDNKINLYWDKNDRSYDYKINVFSEKMELLYSLISQNSCIKFNNLKDNTFYRFTVIPRFENNGVISEGIESEIAVCTTGIPAVENIEISAGIQKISLSWDIVETASLYEIKVSDKSGRKVKKTNTKNTEASIGKLTENNSYLCSVRAVSEINGVVKKGIWSAPLCVSVGIPLVSDINYCIGTDFIELKWGKIKDAFYTVEYKKYMDSSSPALCISTINNTEYRITDIEPDTFYQIRIRADKNEDGKIFKGQYSESILVHTAEITENPKPDYNNSTVSSAVQPVFPEILNNISYPSPAYDNKICTAFTIPQDGYEVFSVALLSMLKNSNSDNQYDIIVITENTNPVKAEKLYGICSNYSNVSIRFFDIQPLLFAWGCGKINARPYEIYKLFIPEILKNYQKAICLDCNTFIYNDIAQLYNLNLNGNAMAASPLITDFTIYSSSNIAYNMKNIFGSEFIDLNSLSDISTAIFDIEKINEDNIISRLIAEAKAHDKFIYDCSTQCFNKIMKNNIERLPVSWSLPFSIAYSYPNFKNHLPENIADEIIDALSNRNITHYNEFLKPWNCTELSYNFMAMAELSPFCNELTAMYNKNTGNGKSIKLSFIINKNTNDEIFSHTLNSFINQSLKQKEIIIVDSKSEKYNEYNCFKSINEAVNSANGAFIMLADGNTSLASYDAAEILYSSALCNNSVCCSGNFAKFSTERPADNISSGEIKIIYAKQQPESCITQFIWKKDFISDNISDISDNIFSTDSCELINLLIKTKSFIKIEKLICYSDNCNLNQISDILKISRINGLSDLHTRWTEKLIKNINSVENAVPAQREVNISMLTEYLANEFNLIQNFKNELPYIDFYNQYINTNSETPKMIDVKIPESFIADAHYQWFISDTPDYNGKAIENTDSPFLALPVQNNVMNSEYYIYCCVNNCPTQIIKAINMLPVPKHLTASSENGNIILKWSNIDEISGYSIFVHTASQKFVRATVAHKNSHIIKDLPKGVPYLFKVRAFIGEKDDRIFGEFTAPVRAVPSMEVPDNLKTSQIKGGIKIEWNNVSDADGYIVNIIDSEENITSSYTSEPEYSVYSLKVAEKYEISVQSFIADSKGSKIFSSFTPPVSVYQTPEPPENIIVDITDGNLKVSWDKVEDTDGYSVFIYTPQNQYVKSASTDKLTHTLKGIPSGQYIMRVRCFIEKSAERINGAFSDDMEIQL